MNPGGESALSEVVTVTTLPEEGSDRRVSRFNDAGYSRADLAWIVVLLDWQWARQIEFGFVAKFAPEIKAVVIAIILQIKLLRPDIDFACGTFLNRARVGREELLQPRAALICIAAVEILGMLRSIRVSMIVTEMQALPGLPEYPGSRSVTIHNKTDSHFVLGSLADDHLEGWIPRKRTVVAELHNRAAPFEGVAVVRTIVVQELSLLGLIRRTCAAGEENQQGGMKEQGRELHRTVITAECLNCRAPERCLGNAGVDLTLV